ncbi:MAG: alpha/beta hydrolase [Halieaceae bacterium]|jgi:acetyl esterase/lipase|nr:alpha/beta hydrolase [Halieaceae bacterium]
MTVYLILAILSAVFTGCALVKGRRLYYGIVPWFFAGWLTGELAWLHMAWQWVLTLLVTLSGGMDSSAGQWGLGIFLLNWMGLGWLHLQSGDAARVLETALRDSLGSNYRGDIPQQRQHVLDAGAPSSGWLKPFSMRRPGVRVHRDIAYGEHGVRNQLDIYQPDSPREGGYPILLQVHGGGWMVGNKQQQGLPLMNHLAARGWLAVSCNYRLSPKAAFPDHIIDVKRCIAWLREHARDYGGNPDFIAITGGSAGGHLASLAALTPGLADWQPGFEAVDTTLQAAVPFYGVYDFLDRDNLRGSMSMEKILSEYVMKTELAAAREAWDQASPISHVSDAAPPFFVLQGTHDSLVWVEEARSFVNRLRAHSEQVVAYAELPYAQHAFEVFHSLRTDHSIDSVTGFLEWTHARWLDDR